MKKQPPLIGDVVLGKTVETQLNAGKLSALADLLRGGTLNELPSETVGLLPAGILALAERETSIELVKGE